VLQSSTVCNVHPRRKGRAVWATWLRRPKEGGVLRLSQWRAKNKKSIYVTKHGALNTEDGRQTLGEGGNPPILLRESCLMRPEGK